MPETIRGKTFVLARSSSGDSSLDEAAQLLAHLGGVVVLEVTPELDYLVVLDRRTGRDLLSPTPEEALALLRAGDEGLEQWRRRHGDQARVVIDLSGADLRGAKLTDIVLYRVKLDGAD